METLPTRVGKITEPLPDQVFALRGPGQTEEWYIVVSGRVYGAWDNKGAAEAGLSVERRRNHNRQGFTKL